MDEYPEPYVEKFSDTVRLAILAGCFGIGATLIIWVVSTS